MVLILVGVSGLWSVIVVSLLAGDGRNAAQVAVLEPVAVAFQGENFCMMY
jgi:hypothetical protein